ncbi:hypothetical protein ACHAXT_006500 [Thalassiosira profunda]
MDDDDDGSDATTLGGSEDLLADASQDNDDNSGGGNAKSNARGNQNGEAPNAHPSALLLSPISPATQTLDRLSHYGSQEGGAELCLHLLGSGSKKGSGNNNDDEEGGGNGGSAARGTEGEDRGTSSRATASFQLANDNDGGSGREHCLRELEAYFASTQNSAVVAATSELDPPPVPFCRRCNADPAVLMQFSQQLSQQPSQSSATLPHHALCPRHGDFYRSGSYEILCLTVEGNVRGCDACVRQFETGRPSKELVHGRGCPRGKKKGEGKKKAPGRAEQGDIIVEGRGKTATGAEEAVDATQAAAALAALESPPTPEVDEDGRPLSAYEKKRRRNIRRNEKRLRSLGLLDRPGPGSTGGAGRGAPAANRPKKKKPSREGVERRVQPKRTGSKPAEGEGGKPESKDSVADRREKEPPRRGGTKPAKGDGGKPKEASLAEAAATGCKKCSDELATGKKAQRESHDVNCPRRKWGKKKGGCGARNELEPRPSEEDSGNGRENKRQQNQPTKQSKAPARKAPTLVDAAKAGCKKCTKEWQTNEVDPTTNHDARCLRVGKKPPSAGPQRASKGTVISPMPGAHDYRPSPSPAPRKKAKTAPKQSTRQPPPLPSWITDFLSESDRNDQTVPVPRGSKWLPCPNPWGKIGHEEGDFVVISPFQSESEGDLLSIYHQGPNGGVPKRFVANPLEEGSPYHATHRGPERGGYSVLSLRRDRAGLRPWGFTARMHEFGGACLVDGVEPLSPAEAATDISGWMGKDGATGLKLHDMIIAVNGKSVGSMTMPELQIELDVSGPQLMLVVSRFDVHESVACAGEGSTTLEDLAMDWNEIGPGAPLKRKRVSFEDEPSDDRFEPEGHFASQNEHEGEGEDIKTGEEEDEGSAFQADLDRGTAGSGVKQSARGEEAVASASKLQAPKTTAKAARLGPKKAVSLSEGAQSGCKKCIREQRTGSKEKTKHGANCPRKVRPTVSDGAESGCKKCILELRTGINKPGAHDENCPRKTGPRVSKKVREEAKGKPSESNVGLGIETQADAKTTRPSVAAENAVEPKEKQTASEGSQKQKRGPKPLSRYQKQLEELSDEGDLLPPKKAEPEEDSCGSSEAEYNADGDESPWLGCVCGRTHPHPIKVFWVQCNGCDAWHEVAEECVGFDEEAAQALEEWFCWSCEPPVEGLGL